MSYMNNPKIYFYIPVTSDTRSDSFWNFGELPKTLKEYYESPFSRTCISAWILQTYLHLKKAGFPCKLVHNLPSEGIIVAICGSLLNLTPGPRQLFVSIQADRDYLHPFAQVHVLQNAMARLRYKNIVRRLIFPGIFTYMPHWPQPGLIPRNPERGDRFENVAYFGRGGNLAPELKTPEWDREMTCLGLKSTVIENENRWNDYSDVDAVLAVRSFDSKQYLKKPASKLYNAWLAGVPAVLGPESAYRGERKNDLDYIELNSPADAISALKRLKENKAHRKAMVENGHIRAREVSEEAMINRWREMFTEIVKSAYKNWYLLSENKKREHFIKCYFVYFFYKIHKAPRSIQRRLNIRNRNRPHLYI